MGGVLELSAFLRMLMKPIVRPLARLIVGILAIPLFRVFLKKVAKVKTLDDELEKDLEQWFRGALVLLVATKNMEANLFDWYLGTEPAGMDPILFALRLSLAIAVIEFMPDQELFAIIHANPPAFDFKKNGFWAGLQANWWPWLLGTLGQQINRYAPVFAILSVAFDGVIGWIGYFTAIALYLFIGLVTSRDKALDVLGEFDKQVALRRRELIEEFHLEDSPPDFTPQPLLDAPPDTAPDTLPDDDGDSGSNPREAETPESRATTSADEMLPDFGPVRSPDTVPEPPPPSA